MPARLLSLTCAALASGLALAAQATSLTVVIPQQDIHFVPALTAVPVGTTVRFSNQDPYDHRLRSEPGRRRS